MSAILNIALKRYIVYSVVGVITIHRTKNKRKNKKEKNKKKEKEKRKALPSTGNMKVFRKNMYKLLDSSRSMLYNMYDEF